MTVSRNRDPNLLVNFIQVRDDKVRVPDIKKSVYPREPLQNPPKWWRCFCCRKTAIFWRHHWDPRSCLVRYRISIFGTIISTVRWKLQNCCGHIVSLGEPWHYRGKALSKVHSSMFWMINAHSSGGFAHRLSQPADCAWLVFLPWWFGPGHYRPISPTNPPTETLKNISCHLVSSELWCTPIVGWVPYS